MTNKWWVMQSPGQHLSTTMFYHQLLKILNKRTPSSVCLLSLLLYLLTFFTIFLIFVVLPEFSPTPVPLHENNSHPSFPNRLSYYNVNSWLTIPPSVRLWWTLLLKLPLFLVIHVSVTLSILERYQFPVFLLVTTTSKH